MDPFPTPRPNYYKVLIKCNTFNHSKFIEDTLNGFVMQQTTFPYVCLIINDASTDGEQKLIKSFLQKECDMSKVQRYDTEPAEVLIVPHRTNQQCTLAIYLLRENHYSIKRSKIPYIQPWRDCCTYEAKCEGDDYWIDPHKLQKQVDYLESHPDYTMVCNRTKLYSEKKKKYIGENYCYNKDATIKTKDVIYRSGLFISTCSIIYRLSLLKNYPDYCRKCAVGDYPLQIMAAMKGYIYYFNDIMSVYRVQNSESWMSQQKWSSVEEKNLARLDSMLNMFKGFSQDFPEYSHYFRNKITQYLITGAPLNLPNKEKDIETYYNYYKKDIHKFPLWGKILYKLKYTNIPILRGYYVTYTEPIFKRFRYKNLIYKK